MPSPASAAVIVLLCAGPLVAQDRPYDPMAVPARVTVKTVDLTIRDDGRRRDIPRRVYYSDKTAPAPLVLFSHGLGGSRENNPYLGNHWAARGYVVVFVQHLGSDTSVWQGRPVADRMKAMQDAANVENLLMSQRVARDREGRAGVHGCLNPSAVTRIPSA